MKYQIIDTNNKLFNVVRIIREDRQWDLETLR